MRSAAVIIEHDGLILLLQRGSTAPWMPNRWNLPGGMVEPGETTTEAAVREAEEETGLRILSLKPLVRSRIPGLPGETIDVFYATRWSGRRVRLDDESQHYAWVPRETVLDADLVPPLHAVFRRFVRWPAS
jgi:8-oxo-dGTP pyrophosphatase MutT (NUDIX family)